MRAYGLSFQTITDLEVVATLQLCSVFVPQTAISLNLALFFHDADVVDYFELIHQSLKKSSKNEPDDLAVIAS